MKCSNCGEVINNDAKFCGSCGGSVVTSFDDVNWDKLNTYCEEYVAFLEDGHISSAEKRELNLLAEDLSLPTKASNLVDQTLSSELNSAQIPIEISLDTSPFEHVTEGQGCLLNLQLRNINDRTLRSISVNTVIDSGEINVVLTHDKRITSGDVISLSEVLPFDKSGFHKLELIVEVESITGEKFKLTSETKSFHIVRETQIGNTSVNIDASSMRVGDFSSSNFGVQKSVSSMKSDAMWELLTFKLNQSTNKVAFLIGKMFLEHNTLYSVKWLQIAHANDNLFAREHLINIAINNQFDVDIPAETIVTSFINSENGNGLKAKIKVIEFLLSDTAKSSDENYKSIAISTLLSSIFYEHPHKGIDFAISTLKECQLPDNVASVFYKFLFEFAKQDCPPELLLPFIKNWAKAITSEIDKDPQLVDSAEVEQVLSIANYLSQYNQNIDNNLTAVILGLCKETLNGIEHQKMSALQIACLCFCIEKFKGNKLLVNFDIKRDVFDSLNNQNITFSYNQQKTLMLALYKSGFSFDTSFYKSLVLMINPNYKLIFNYVDSPDRGFSTLNSLITNFLTNYTDLTQLLQSTNDPLYNLVLVDYCGASGVESPNENTAVDFYHKGYKFYKNVEAFLYAYPNKDIEQAIEIWRSQKLKNINYVLDIGLQDTTPSTNNKTLIVDAVNNTPNLNIILGNEMAFTDTIKVDTLEKNLLQKYSPDNIKVGLKILVKSGQQAVIVKGGRVSEIFEPGSHHLNKDSSVDSEIWFVNKSSILDNKWGTKTPLNIEDPRYRIIVPIRAFGQYGMKVNDTALLINTLSGSMGTLNSFDIQRFFQGKVISSISSLIAKKITQEGISLLDLSAYLDELSLYCQTSIAHEFNKFGLELSNFFFESINIPQNDPSFLKLKEAKDKAMHVSTVGQEVYKFDRNMDVMNTAAQNGVVGISNGFTEGGNPTNNNVTSGANVPPPPAPSTTTYLLHINGQQHGPYTFDVLKSYLASGQVAPNTQTWKEGLVSWVKLSDLPEFNSNQVGAPPPPPPQF